MHVGQTIQPHVFTLALPHITCSTHTFGNLHLAQAVGKKQLWKKNMKQLQNTQKSIIKKHVKNRRGCADRHHPSCAMSRV
jgi:hypothetical protein